MRTASLFLNEMLVGGTGDDIKTITKYYADPAQPNVGAMKVVDLL